MHRKLFSTLFFLLTFYSTNSFSASSDRILIDNYSLGFDQTCTVVNKKLDCWVASEWGLGVSTPRLTSVDALSSGNAHTCAITQGKVVCWGEDRGGNLEVPANIVDPRKIVSSSRIRGAFVSGSINCVLAKSGSACWGDKSIPLENISQDSVISVNFGNSAPYICLGSKKGVNCFHLDSEVQWVNEAVKNAPQSITNVKAITSGNEHTCAIANNKVECWGSNKLHQLDFPSNLKNPREISAGNVHTCVLDDEGVKCWGYDGNGRLNPPVGLLNPRNLQSYEDQSCAITDNGLKCWGRYEATSNAEFEVYIPTGLKNVDVFNQSEDTACANTSEGLKCWGKFRNNPKMLNVKEVASGVWHACAMNNVDIKCWGVLYSDQEKVLTPPTNLINPRGLVVGRGGACVIDDSGLKCWGKAGFVVNAPTDLVNPRKIVVKGDLACAVTDLGIRCWGTNHAPYIQKNFNKLNITSPLTDIDFEEYYSYDVCGVSAGNLVCGGSSHVDYPQDLKGVSEITSTQIGSSANAKCAIHQDGVKCWGLKELENTPSALKNPRQISLNVWSNLKYASACALTDDGIKCWGVNTFVPTKNYSW